MSARQNPDRAEIEGRIARTRQEFLALCQPLFDARAARALDPRGVFPRSRALRFVMRHKGLGTVAMAACGMLLSRPGLALRVMRTLPIAALLRFLLRQKAA